MKIIIKVSGVLITVLLLLTCFTASAANVVLYSNDFTINKNRISHVNIKVESDIKLSAATFEITYDTRYVEFRETEAKLDNITVKSKDNGSSVKAVFFSADGVSLSSDTVLFVFKFKTIEYGETDFSIKMYDCVDSNAKEISAESSTNCKVHIESTAKYDSNTSNADDKSSANSTQKTTDAKINNQDKGLKKFSSIVDSVGEKQALLGTIIAVGLAVIILVLFFISNKKDNQKQEKENKE